MSSAEAELVAAVKAATEALGCQSILKDLVYEVQVKLGMDASAAIAMINRDGLGKAKHVETQFLWLREMVRKKKVLPYKVSTSENPADLMTKPIDESTIIKHKNS